MRELIFSATKKDFRVDTFASGGPGGQHQNKTQSGVRITHIPTGLSAECRETRSQGENKKRAFRKLAARLVARVKTRTIPPTSQEVVRTYHFPEQRVKDHVSGLVRRPSDVLNDPSEMIESRRKAV